ncbi:MinD/ParA family protein [Syntrophothermus lipocalidus]|uniref:Cobyrinic acid ac-diamide synthase n=1 Tax=Syntrophothermus lipocalidus (strain DSM 12680 / TGB-C1) TaxID=643648 RepID=D7CM19_SYNLT|nr:MinD/ParA family protein [Syntrophothermus lipocalidus]ADI01754.1 Cobyrinic acid ac-diamide synthase [Syntrophothermus lipocalidus DSM 12680]
MKDQAERLRLMAKSLKTRIENDLVRGMKHTRVVVVTSGKGGVGKTNLALNLALALAESGLRIVLLDADMGLANVDIILGLAPKYNLYHVIRGEKGIKEIILHGPCGLEIIPGGSGIQELANLPEEALQAVIRDLGRLDGEYDLMIIDTGAGISNSVLSYVTAADDIVVVTTPEPTSLTDAYGIIKAASNRQARGAVYIVVNRVETETEGILVAQKLISVGERFLGVEMKLLGCLVEDRAVEVAVKNQQPFLVSHPNSQVSRNVRDIARKLHDKSGGDKVPVKASGLRSFFRNLTSFLR